MYGGGQFAHSLGQAARTSRFHQRAADHDGIGMPRRFARLYAIADAEPSGDGQIRAGSQTINILLCVKHQALTRADYAFH